MKNRRAFLAKCLGLGLGSTLFPGLLWAKMDETGTGVVTPAMVKSAAILAGLDFTDEDCAAFVSAVAKNRRRTLALHQLSIPYTVRPPLYFNPLVPGMQVNRKRLKFRPSKSPEAARPRNLEEVAFWPVTSLARLIQTRQVTSRELTEMYLARLKRHNGTLNCVVTFLDDLARAQARRADADIAAGRYQGALHGIPWGAKDLMAVRGHPTTWGSNAYRDQVFDQDASVVQMLEEAGAVLLAKLATGELAVDGDQWFGGRTNNPWKPDQGSTGSSAGSAAAAAAGLVGFALGTDTGGSILSPAARCGATGLRPTFGRVSCHGVMPLGWSRDRVGPICRSVEDCAMVMATIARPDGRDLSVADIPFNWDARLDTRNLRLGYVQEAFADQGRNPDFKRNDRQTLADFQSMGFKLVPVKVPDFPLDILSVPGEAGAAFDELIRTSRFQKLTIKNPAKDFRPHRLSTAADYLQAQRARMMMMEKLAEATAAVDVFLAPLPAWGEDEPDNYTHRIYSMGNSAGYPALSLPNGFAADGTPTSINIMARPFGETELLAVAKQYQDSTGYNLKRPPI